MLCVIPFHAGDFQDAKRLLLWIADLGGCPKHECLLIADEGLGWQFVFECKKLAEQSFEKVHVISNGEHKTGIEGANSMFKAAAIWALENGKYFYFNEPDAIPLKYGWLDEIEIAYKNCPSKVMGAVVSHETPNLPNPYVEGCSVYPSDIWTYIEKTWNPKIAWPLACASVLMPMGTNTELLHHVWGETGNPPVFADKNIPGTNVFCLKNIKEGAVVFHRSKGGSLIRLLRKARGISQSIVVVFPVCQMDVGLAIHHAKWLVSMRQKWSHSAVVVFDSTINVNQLMEFRNLLNQCFLNVETWKYPIPPVGGWPHAPNWAWQQTAIRMADQNNPWFWFEADSVALTPDWIESIDDEYQGCGKSWMGAVVKGMGHMNGVGIYPCDAAFRMPDAMSCTNLAWDYVCKNEIERDLHDASHLIQHCWTLVNGEPIETGGGELPARFTAEQCSRWIRKGAAVFHRSKDASIVELLMSGQYRHE